MNHTQVYLLDSNVFIEAARRYYAFDIAPTFWQELVNLRSDGKVISIDRVKVEIDRGKDELATWASKEFHDAFATTGEANVLTRYRVIIEWARIHPGYTDAAKNEFAKADNADAWLIAYAAVHGNVVVTHEQPNPLIERRIPIPNVCRAFNIDYVDTFQMLRTLGVRL